MYGVFVGQGCLGCVGWELFVFYEGVKDFVGKVVWLSFRWLPVACSTWM